MTLIGAISIEGVVAKKTIIGSMKGKDFKSFEPQNLGPKLKPGNVVVMDHLNIHKMEGIEELITAEGSQRRIFTTLLTATLIRLKCCGQQ